MIAFIGTLLIIYGVASYVVPNLTREVRDRSEGASAYDYKMVPLLPFNLPYGWATILGGFIMIIGVNNMIFKADASKAYVLQYPFGGTETIVNKNGYTGMWWASMTEVDCEISIKHLVPDNWTRYQEGDWQDSEEGYMVPAGDFEFNDLITAHLGNVVVVETCAAAGPEFTQVILNSKSESGLVYNRIIPQINVALKNTAKLMGAQDYMYGASSQFDELYFDQLQYGTYALEVDSTSIRYNAPDVLASGDPTTIDPGEQAEQRVKYKIKRGVNDEPVRINQGLGRYNLRIIQADADNIAWDPRFKKRLENIQDIVTKRQESLENTRFAIQEVERVTQEGEQAKAKEQADREVTQIQLVIKAQTAVQVAIQNKLEAQTLKETASIKAQTVEIKAKADAYKNRSLVAAGLTPQERAQIDKEIAIGVAAEIAKIQLPTTFVAGSNGNSNSETGLLETVLGTGLMLKLFPNE